MDLSYSMKDDLENVKNLGTDLMREMQSVTSDFRIGMGVYNYSNQVKYQWDRLTKCDSQAHFSI